ncbi:MAG TPA: DinB family protein [Thermoanaerobaculia bacterium]
MEALREHLIQSLDWDHAHIRFDDAVKDFPPELRGKRPAGGPHSPWELLEHLRITLWDILEFTRDAKHVSPEFPAGYWPPTEAPPDDGAWDERVAAYREDLRAFSKLLESIDLYTPIAHGSGQTPLREALLLLDHNAYHVGQLMMVRRILEG